MAQYNSYELIIVEGFTPANTSGLHGKIHVRPVVGEKYPQTLHVECSKDLSTDYPVGTKFRIRVKLTDKEGGGEYLYNSYRWKYEVVELPS